jgi:hypothetical protein
MGASACLARSPPWEPRKSRVLGSLARAVGPAPVGPPQKPPTTTVPTLPSPAFVYRQSKRSQKLPTADQCVAPFDGLLGSVAECTARLSRDGRCMLTHLGSRIMDTASWPLFLRGRGRLVGAACSNRECCPARGQESAPSTAFAHTQHHASDIFSADGLVRLDELRCRSLVLARR